MLRTQPSDVSQLRKVQQVAAEVRPIRRKNRSPPTNAMLPPTNAVLKPTNAVLTPTNAVLTPTNAALKSTDAILLPANVILPPPTNAHVAANQRSFDANQRRGPALHRALNTSDAGFAEAAGASVFGCRAWLSSKTSRRSPGSIRSGAGRSCRQDTALRPGWSNRSQ